MPLCQYISHHIYLTLFFLARFEHQVQLAILTPRGVYVWRHDGVFGVWTIKKARFITIAGPPGVADWQEALDDYIMPQVP